MEHKQRVAFDKTETGIVLRRVVGLSSTYSWADSSGNRLEEML